MKNRGFTLIEVLIALLIVSAAIVATSSLWGGNFMRMRKAALNYDAATLLERKMVEIEAKYKDKPLEEIVEEDTGDFGTDFPQYRWTMKSRELTLPDLTAVLVGQEEGADEMLINMMKQLTEYLQKSIKEVKVSVFVKRGKRELEYSAAQYFVDYSKDFMGGAAGATGGTGQ